jgi:hypothetical protein
MAMKHLFFPSGAPCSPVSGANTGSSTFGLSAYAVELFYPVTQMNQRFTLTREYSPWYLLGCITITLPLISTHLSHPSLAESTLLRNVAATPLESILPRTNAAISIFPLSLSF